MQTRFEIGSKVYSSQHGAGEVIAVDGSGENEKLTIRFERAGVKTLMSAFSVLEPAEEPLPPAPTPGTSRGGPDIAEIRQALREVIAGELGLAEVRLLDRWRGGRLVIRSGREGQKDKEIPIDDFFHKIVMVRDRLRVLEQKINAHAGLSDADKVELQQYVTRIYGSLTTFNVLFADRDDWFVGQKGEE